MATQNNTMKTRVQLKRDTEANWNQAGPKQNSPGFIPLAGELIVYLPDSTHDYSRLKVGDGATNVVYLPFIDAGTVNGETIVNEIVTFSGNLPASGDSTKLYVSTTNKSIYYYDGTNWQKLSNHTYTFSKHTATRITGWSAGTATQLSLSGGTLFVTNGTVPTLDKEDREFVSNIVKEGES